MAQLAYPTLQPTDMRLRIDFRGPKTATGTIKTNNRVIKRVAGISMPMPGIRVRLHRLIDGWCAWQGMSDDQGYYWSWGLEVGMWYVPVAIDLSQPRQYESVAAGPVLAEDGGDDAAARES